MQVIFNLASEHPLASRRGNHLCSDRCGRKYIKDISTVTLVKQGVAIEVDGVKIYVIPNTKKMPRHGPSKTHFQCRQVPINKAVYCWSTKNNKKVKNSTGIENTVYLSP